MLKHPPHNIINSQKKQVVWNHLLAADCTVSHLSSSPSLKHCLLLLSCTTLSVAVPGPHPPGPTGWRVHRSGLRRPHALCPNIDIPSQGMPFRLRRTRFLGRVLSESRTLLRQASVLLPSSSDNSGSKLQCAIRIRQARLVAKTWSLSPAPYGLAFASRAVEKNQALGHRGGQFPRGIEAEETHDSIVANRLDPEATK